MLRISVSVVPTHGNPVDQTVEVAPSGASVQEICKAAGIDTENKDLTVNGQPAGLRTHVGQNDVLAAKERGKPVVTTSERPRGS
jgi:hypothetical protein